MSPLLLRRILFATDHSPCADRAFAHAAFLAEQTGASLTLLRVEPVTGTTPGPRHHYALPDGVVCVEETVRSGDVAATIVEHARDADVVVMGTHGRRNVQRVRLGSVTEQVMRHADCPVLAVGLGAERPGPVGVTRLLIPLDFSDTTATALALSDAVAALYGARVDVLHAAYLPDVPDIYGVGLLPVQSYPDITERVQASLRALVERRIAPARRGEVVVAVGPPGPTILREAERLGSGLVVMPTHGRTGLERLAFGSVAEHVLRRAPCAVLAVPPQARIPLGEVAAADVPTAALLLPPLHGPCAATDADFPRDGPAEAQLTALLNWAVQAPSVLNTQPWRFDVQGRTVRIFVDRTRQLQTVDPDGREAVVSCGAALLTLRLAAAHFGFSTLVEYAPTGPDHVATFHLGDVSEASDEDERLFRAIRERHTNRDPYAALALPAALLARLRAAAESEGAHLVALTGEAETAPVAELVAEAIQTQGRGEATVAELEAWLRPTDDRRADGVPDDVQGGWDRLSYLTADARVLASEAARLVRTAPALLVLSTEGDETRDWVRAGQALQRVLLTAAAEGLAASYFNQPTEVPHLRRQLPELTGPGVAQVVFRLGTPIEARGTPRRSVANVLVS